MQSTRAPKVVRGRLKMTPKILAELRLERRDTTPLIDPEARALTRFLNREGIDCSKHSNPVLAKLILQFLARRKRH
jgi:hypothetical protein